MEAFELSEIIAKGESSKVQFKKKVTDAYKISAEMVAFSNSKGGMIIIGVDDKTGDVKGLSYKEIQDTNSLLVNATSKKGRNSPVPFPSKGEKKEGK